MEKGPVSSPEKEYLKTDVLVVGAGVTGCAATIMAAEKGLRVTLISKSLVGKSGCSRLATNLAGGPPEMYMSTEDREKLAAMGRGNKEEKGENKGKGEGPRRELTQVEKDQLSMFAAYMGHYIIDQDYLLDAAYWIANNFYDFVEKRGLYIRRMPDGRVLSNTGPVHQRNTWAPRQGQTGPQLMDLMRHEVLGLGVDIREECMVTSLLTNETGEVTGATALDMRTGKFCIISAKATFFCTGNSNNIATRTTASPEETGDGWAIAYRAGAELQNHELQYIHCVDNKDPYTLNIHCYPNPNPNTDRTPHLVDSEGQFFFTPDMFRQGTTVMYHLQLKRIIKKIYEGKARVDGGYYSSYKHMVEYVDSEFQEARRIFDKLGYNIAVEPIENAMNWEMSEGGIRCDMKTMQSSLPGLYAPGAAGGHGLGGFINCVYDAHLAVNHAAKRCEQVRTRDPDPNQVASEEARLLAYLRTEPRKGYKPAVLQTKLRQIIYDTLVPIKNEEKMKKGLTELRKIREEMVPEMALESASLNYNVGWLSAINLDYMLEIAELKILASLERKESRGPFFREDYPYTDNENWCVYNIVKLVDGAPKFRQETVDLKYIRPAEAKADYFKVIY